MGIPVLTSDIKRAETLPSFRGLLKAHLFDEHFDR
jgi:hypothetical protein